MSTTDFTDDLAADHSATLAELDTPALCLDLDRFERNLQTVVNLCRERGVDWRPHAKCHKSQDVGSRLVAAGALGLTCAKLGEAEVLGIRPGPLTAVINRAGRTNDARLVMAEIRQSYLDFSGQVRVANTVVPTAVAYNEAATARCPVHRMRSTQAYTTMLELVWELLPNLHGVYAGGAVAEPTLLAMEADHGCT